MEFFTFFLSAALVGNEDNAPVEENGSSANGNGGSCIVV